MANKLPALAGVALHALLPWGSAALAQPQDPFLQTARQPARLPVAERPSPAIAAPAEAAGADSAGAAVDVGAVAVQGLQALQPADFADVIAPRLGQTLRPDALAALASDIAARARARGFVLATAWIEPQVLNAGVLAVRVDEGRIDEIRLAGVDHPGVRAVLARLITGQPVRVGTIERQLLAAGDIPGVRVLGSSFAREGGRGVLTVSIRRDRIAARATFANEGTRPLGREQLTITADINGVLAADDAVSLTWSATPFQPGELEYGRVRYERRIGRSGTALSLTGSLARARPGAYLAPLAIRSHSWQAEVAIVQPLVRERARSLWFEADLTMIELEQTRTGVLVRDDRVVAARGTFYGYARLGPGTLRGQLGLSQGLAILGARAERVPGGAFTKATLAADWTGPLAGPFSLRLAALGQLAAGPVPVTEALGLGGSEFLRGYDWFERSGDEGVMGLIEVRYAIARPFAGLSRAQLYAFADAGRVRQLQTVPGSAGLASLGGGLRADMTQHLGATVELALPLRGPRYDSGNRAAKVNFSVTERF